MEWIDGKTFDRAWLEAVSDVERLELVLQAHEALDFLHARRVVHSDIKPENLLVSRTSAGPDLRLVDFSLARSATAGFEGEGGRGTPAYAAPEVLRGRSPDVLSDRYSLGRVLAEAVAVRPLEGVLGEALATVVTRLTSRDPDERFASADELRGTLLRSVPAAELGPRSTVRAAFVGRQRELEELERALGSATEDSGARQRTIRIEGPRGSGRSRLLEEAALLASLRGHETLVRTAAEVDAALVERVLRLAPECECTLFIDDADEVDPGLLRALEERVLEPGSGIRALVVVRDEPTGDVADPGERGVRISPLSFEESTELVNSVLAVRPDATRLARAIAAAVDGDPAWAERAAQAALPLTVHADPEEVVGVVAAAAPDTSAPAGAVALLVRDLLAVEPDGARSQDLEVLVHDMVGAGDWDLERGDLRRSKAVDGARLQFRGEAWRLRHLGAMGAERRRLARQAWHRAASTGLVALSTASAFEHALRVGSPAELGRAASAELRARMSRQSPRAALRLVERTRAALGERGAQVDREIMASVAETVGDALLATRNSREALAAFRLAARVGEGSAEREGLRCKQARALVEGGRFAHARARLTRVLRESTTVSVRAAAWEILGELEAKSGDLEAAERVLVAGLAEFRDAEHDPGASSLWNNLGVVSRMSGRSAEAREHHLQSLRIRRACDDEEGVARSLGNLGLLELDAGRVEIAESTLLRALAIKERLGWDLAASVDMVNLGLLEVRRGRLSAALRLLERALELRAEASDSVGEARGMSHLAGVWLHKGRLDQALLHSERSLLELARMRIGGVARTEALVTRAEIEEALGRSSDARHYVEQALLVCSAAGTKVEHASASALLERIVARDEPEGARERLAVLEGELAPSQDSWDLHTQGRLRLAAAWFQLGEVARARTLLEPLLASVGSGRDRAAEIEARLLLGGCLEAESLINEASRHMHVALELARSGGFEESEWRICAALGRLHQRQGRHGRADAWRARCLDLFRHASRHLHGAALAGVYLSHPERAAVLDALEQGLER